MNTHCHHFPDPIRPTTGGDPSASAAAGRRRAFSLLEMVGVLAVMAILMLAVLPSLLKDLTLKFHASEAASLTTIINGLRSYVGDTRQIPGPATFAQNIALELGWLVSDVSTNAHGNARLYLADPALRIGPPPLTPFSTLPYVQGTNGSAQPVNPRVMVISSLGAPLSATITAGAATNAALFAQIWSSTDGTTPVGWSGSEDWSYILIQRLNLAPMFVQLLLNNNSSTPGWYSIDNTNSPVVLPSVPSFSAFYLVGTGVGLHTTGGTPMQVQQVLQDFPPNISPTNLSGTFLVQGNSFVYDQGIWRGRLFMSTTNGLRGGVDLQAACNIFLSGPQNVYKTGTLTQSNIVQDMWNYMSNYVYWATTATSSYPGGFDPKNKPPVVASQITMNSDVGTYCNKKAKAN
jgi:hypothetical protein